MSTSVMSKTYICIPLVVTISFHNLHIQIFCQVTFQLFICKCHCWEWYLKIWLQLKQNKTRMKIHLKHLHIALLSPKQGLENSERIIFHFYSLICLIPGISEWTKSVVSVRCCVCVMAGRSRICCWVEIRDREIKAR